jgi:hypothetical protein
MKDTGGGEMSPQDPITRPSTREITSLPVSGLPQSLSNSMAVAKKKPWNTKNLLLRLGVDAAAAACAATLIAPIITTIDRYGPFGDGHHWSRLTCYSRGIMENVSGKVSLTKSLINSAKKFLFRPHAFVFSKPFALIFVRRHFSQLHRND